MVIGLLLAGAASWVGFSGGERPERESWRQAVLDYMDLYTPDTFAFASPSLNAFGRPSRK